MLSRPVKIGNIDDAEAFVRHCMNKAPGIILTNDERDDLAAEGLLLLLQLHRHYDPRKDKDTGGKTSGFFGYALYLLPKKLSDAWHHSNEHHALRTQPNGTRRYEYFASARSIDDDSLKELPAIEVESEAIGTQGHYYAPGSLPSAIALMPDHQQHIADKMLHQMEQGYRTHEICKRLDLKQNVVRGAQHALASAIWQLGHPNTNGGHA